MSVLHRVPRPAGLPWPACAAQRGGAGAWRRAQPAARLIAARRPRVRGPLLASRARSRPSPVWRCSPCSTPSCSPFRYSRNRRSASRSGARIPARAPGLDALFDAADPSKRHRRADRPRSGRDRGRGWGRHDACQRLSGRGTTRRAGRHGRGPHRRGLDHRRRHAGDAGRPDEPRQLHLLRPADRELDLRPVRAPPLRRWRSSSTSCSA